MDIASTALMNGVGVVGVVFMVGLLIFKGALIPGPTHRELVSAANARTTQAEERADRWEAVALRALAATEALAEPVAVSAKVLTKLPNPAQEEAPA